MDNLMDLLSIQNITLFIALWGALLSTYKVLSDYSKNKRKLKVKIAYGFVVHGPDVGPTTISVSAINTGFRDITLNSVGFVLPDNVYSTIIEPQSNVRFPYTLSEGKECDVWKTRRQLALELKRNGYSGKIKLRGFYRSATGEISRSKPIDFDIESALTKNE